MRIRIAITTAVALQIVSGTASLQDRGGPPPKMRSVEVRFLKSPMADYLVYLLYRSTGNAVFKDVQAAVPLTDIPTLNELISLPGVAASRRVVAYSDLQPLLEPYRDARDRIIEVRDGQETRYSILGYSETMPRFEDLTQIIRRGESHYGRFKAFWEERIAPAEDQKIAEWREQLASAQPLDTLQRLSRLRYPFDAIDVVAIGMHGAGSANTHPPGIYTGLGVRNIAWAIGHEGTHLLVDRYAGANSLEGTLWNRHGGGGRVEWRR